VAYVRRIVVVCGYGCNLDSPLKPYLDRVLRFCEERHPVAIILCGGATQQRSFPDETEASVMYKYLKPLEHFHPMWFVLGGSYTSYENIRDAAVEIDKLRAAPWHGMEPRHDEITIFCEATRALKVAMLARHFLGFPPERGEPPVRIETDSWELMHPTLELVGTFKEWLAIRLPFFNDLQSARRMRKSLTR